MVRIMEENRIDIKENYIYKLDNELLEILLKDRSSKKNIIWATDNYKYPPIDNYFVVFKIRHILRSE